MKNIYILMVVALIIFSSSIYSQYGWQWQNPQPHGNPYFTVKFVNQNTGWAAGGSGYLFKTTNGGESWFQQITSTVNTLLSIYFIDVNYGWGCDIWGTIIKTTDGGNSWFSFSSGTPSPLNSINFANQNTGWACGYNGVLIKSTNGGNNWTPVSLNTIQTLTNVTFKNENRGWLSGDSGIIYMTSNGGSNWNPYPIPVNQISSLYFIDENTGWGAGKLGKIIKTTNGGLNWVQLNSGISGIQLNSIFFTDLNTGYATGGEYYGESIILKTINGGISWVQINTETLRSFFSVNFINSNTGFAAGLDGYLLKTTDGGNTWTNYTHSISENVTWWSIDFVNSNTGWVCGPYLLGLKNSDANFPFIRNFKNSLSNSYTANGVFKTTNSGDNWNVQFHDTNMNVWAVDFWDSNTGWIGGQNISSDHCEIYNTTNGGLNWFLQYSSSGTGVSNSIFFINSSKGWALNVSPSGPDVVLFTSNGGTNWIEQSLPITNEEMQSIFFIDEFNGWAAGESGTVVRTTNGGTNWEMVVTGTSNELWSICFLNTNTGWAVGGNGTVLHSTNGGVNWSLQTSSIPIYSYLTKVVFTDANTGFISAFAPYYIINVPVYKTTNGGLNWIEKQTGNTNSVISMCFIDAYTGWLAGFGCSILKTTTGGEPIGVKPINEIVPEQYFLHQNYPNPFNPITKIVFELPKSSFAAIIIYDILGREIKKLVYENLRAGKYEIEWNASELSSGVYFYRFTTEEYISTKKMILVK